MSSSSNTGSHDNDWCLIESDPAVFTELLERLGCQGVEFQELYSLEDDALVELLQSTNAVYGLIFLFEWKADAQRLHAETKQPVPEESIPPHLFFAHQVTTNACATQAILSVVLNAVNAPSSSDEGESNSSNHQRLSEKELGKVLSDFRNFTMEFPPNLKGVAVSSSEEIRAAHNSFHATDSFLNFDQADRKDSSSKHTEAFHFVAYVPHHHRNDNTTTTTVYELDGLQNGPIVAGTVDNNNNNSNINNSSERMEEEEDSPSVSQLWQGSWLPMARTAIRERMRAVGADAGAVKFNLMAVIQDKRIPLRNSSNKDEDDAEAKQWQLAQEEQKRAGWKLENQRRRHNYLPLAIQVFKELARTGHLPDLVAAAKEKQATKRKRAQQQLLQK